MNFSELCILQGHEIYVLAEEDALIPNCGEKDKVCPVSHLELRVLESENGLKGTTQGDEELTSLSWLQNTNLLQSTIVFTFISLFSN